MKPEREKKTVWTTWNIEHNTPVGELVAEIFKLLEEHGDSLVVDGYNGVELKCERWETDLEYTYRIDCEAREAAREKKHLKALLEKYGLPEDFEDD